MFEVLGFTVLTLCALGALAAIILFFVAKKFKVEEDPRIEVVEGMLPGANCGGCGFAGCKGLAEGLVKQDDISALYCPVGGGSVMKDIADYLGKSAPEKEPMVAVVKCSGSCELRPRTTVFDGAASCAVTASLYGGETGCSYGCLGNGDCQVVCNFGAISINPETKLPEIDDSKCTACGACVKACPKGVIELRKKAIKDRKVYVACSNKDKGGVARKACKVACIGCSKCQKVCPFDAITIENNLAYIDASKCKLCRKCVLECPTGAIKEINFPPRKAAPAPAPKAAPAPKPVAEAKPVAETKPVAKAVESKPVAESKPTEVKVTETKVTEPVVSAESKSDNNLESKA